MTMQSRNRRKSWTAAAAIAAATLSANHPALARHQNPPSQAPQQSSQQSGTAAANDPALREYLSANGLLNRGLNDLAAEEYRKFLAAHPEHEKALVARYGLGVALFRLKKPDEAAKELQPLLKANGFATFEFAPETLLIIGQCAFEQKQWADAVDPLSQLATNYPKHDAADDAAAMAVESLYRLQRFDDIEVVWVMFDKNWPDSPLRERADYLRGLALVAKKDDAGAAKHFAAMSERFPKGEFIDRATLLRAQCLHREGQADAAAEAYRTLLKKDDVVAADATYGLAALLQAKGEDQEAATLYDVFLQKWPQNVSTGPAMLDRGRLCVAEKQYDRARQLLQGGAEKDQARADEAAYWLAKCDLRQEKFADAAARLKDAIAAYPKSRLRAEMMYDQGVALAKADDAVNAIAALDAFRTAYGEHALEADATALQATLEHQRQGYDASAELCAVFLKEHADHPQAAAIAFLAAEDDMLREKFDDASKKYAAFLSKYADDPQARTAKYRLGSAQFRLQKFDDAKPNLAQVVDGRKTEKAYRRALLMLGDIAFQQQEWDASIAMLGDYLSFGNEQPSTDDATLKLGLAYARTEKLDDAAAKFSDLIAQFPDSPHRLQAVFERGQVLLAQDNLDDSARLFEQVVAAGDSRFRTYALNHLATIAMRQQNWDKAAELYAQVQGGKIEDGASDLGSDAMFHRAQALMAAKKYPEASRAFAAVLEQQPPSAYAAEAQAQRAVALSRSGEHEQALRVIAGVEKSADDKVSADLRAAVAYEKAWCLRELKRDDDAMQAYRDLLAKHITDVNAPHAMLELAEMEAAAANHQKAAELLAQLDKVAGDSNAKVADDVRERGLYRLAVSEFEIGKFDDSAAHAEAFIAAFPKSELIPSAHLFAGEAQFKESKWKPAAEHFEVIVTKHDQDPGCATALLRLGECQAQLQRWPDSEQTFASYLERFSNSDLWFQAQFGVAYARENRGLHDQAIEAYRKVIDRHSGPTAARSQFQIGECLFAQKKHSDAVRELLKVDILYGYPEWSAAALYEAGRCFEEMGQKDQARSQFAQVKEKYPDTEWAKLATQRLAANTNAGATGG